ncbi:MAG TPA: EamA family transporter [Dehalococcoidia bacterium]|nr:EamA family transporter [Dehalococcoidia bacterium]
MIWLLLALLSSATFAVVGVIDKRLNDKYLPSLSSYYVWIAISVFIYGVIFLVMGGIPRGVDARFPLMAGASGLAWGGAMLMFFKGYQMQEVSRASAVVFTFPVFVAIMAALFLDETLVPVQWVAIGLVVSGAILVSLNGGTGSKSAKLAQAFPILVGASLLTAIGHITSKFAVEELSVATVSSFRFFGMAAVLALSWRPATFGHLRQALNSREALVLLLVGEMVLVPAAVLHMITATKLGPVSLVATVTGTRPIFILLYSTLLSLPTLRILSESVDPRSLTVKLVSVMMIIGGIVSLGLFMEGRLACVCPY